LYLHRLVQFQVPRRPRRLAAGRHRDRAQYTALNPGLAAVVNLGNRGPRRAAGT